MQLYKTKDFYEASALIACECRIIELEKEGNFYWFVFDEKDTCRGISQSYWNNTLEVRAKDYAEAIRSLKDRLFANK